MQNSKVEHRDVRRESEMLTDHDITLRTGFFSGTTPFTLLLTGSWPFKHEKSAAIPAADLTGESGLQMELPSPLEGLSGLGGGVLPTLFLRNCSILDATNLPEGEDCPLCVGVLFSLPSELELFVFSTPFDMELLLELLLAVLPVLLFLPLTLNLAKGSTGAGGAASGPEAPLRNASFAARVLSAWFEFVEAKLSEDLYRLSDDLFKFVFDELNTDSELARLVVDLFKAPFESWKLFGFCELSLLLTLRERSLLSATFASPMFELGELATPLDPSGGDGGILPDGGLDVGELWVDLGFTNTGYLGNPELVVLNALLGETGKGTVLVAAAVAAEVATVLGEEPVTATEAGLVLALGEGNGPFAELFRGSELSLVGGSGTFSVLAVSGTVVALLLFAFRDLADVSVTFSAQVGKAKACLFSETLVTAAPFGDVGGTSALGDVGVLRPASAPLLFCALTMIFAFGFPKDGPVSGEGDLELLIGVDG